MFDEQEECMKRETLFLPSLHLAGKLVNGWLEIGFAEATVRERYAQISAGEGLNWALKHCTQGLSQCTELGR
jgi:hypothetical protein